MSQVFKSGFEIGKDRVRVHRGGNRIDGVSKDNELFYNDLPVPKRSKIDLSFDRKLSFNMGQLIPILAQECVPGDTFHIAQSQNILLAPLVSPLFHRVDYRTYYFFVPTRLVDDGFKDFISGKTPDYVLPYFQGRNCDESILGLNTLLDYMDLPVQEENFVRNSQHIIAHPFRAYQLIWNEYFRDEFKQQEIPVFKTGGAIYGSELRSYKCMNIGWEKDYFTTAQVEPQIGPDVPIPGSGSTPSDLSIVADGNLQVLTSLMGSPSSFYGLGLKPPVANSSVGTINMQNESAVHYPVSYRSGLKIQSSGDSVSTGATINDLRIANHLQEYRDKLKIAGARYNEAILAEFGVVVPDYRIQRPEYIGGFATPVESGRVLQTTPTDSSPLGAFAGQGFANGKMDYIHYNCLEHGYIIGVSCVIPRTGYQQGIPRSLIKYNIFDYYHPDFATLGDQAILNDEIYISDNGDSSEPDTSRFGYQQRYAEYKIPAGSSKVNGEFRTSLDFWHMNRIFDSAPVLDGDFITSEPTDRVFAVQDSANKIYAEVYQSIASVRPMPVAVQPNLTNVE